MRRKIFPFIPIPAFSVLLAFLLLLSLADTAESQGRRSRGSRGRSDAASLPPQREPLPRSELDLGAIPHRIVYETLQEAEGDSNWEIMVIDADGSGRVNLTNTPDVDEHYPHASPDGTKILFVAIEGESRRDQSRNVYYMNVDGSQVSDFFT